jgi:uncharacterized protein
MLKTIINVGLVLGIATFALGAKAQQSDHTTNTQAHKVAVHVDEDDPKRMSMALGNVRNIEKYYKSVGEPVTIEIVTNGGGVSMMRSDKSPVKDTIKTMQSDLRDLNLAVCQNTIDGLVEKEGSEPPLLPGVTVVPSGVVRLMELQEQGYSYLRP